MEYVSRLLIESGVDVESVVARLGGNESLYLLICEKFISDQNYNLLQRALFEDDFKKAELYLHTLEGVAANMGFLRLELHCKTLLEDIKRNNHIHLLQHNENLSLEYVHIISIIKEEPLFHILESNK